MRDHVMGDRARTVLHAFAVLSVVVGALATSVGAVLLVASAPSRLDARAVAPLYVTVLAVAAPLFVWKRIYGPGAVAAVALGVVAFVSGNLAAAALLGLGAVASLAITPGRAQLFADGA